MQVLLFEVNLSKNKNKILFVQLLIIFGLGKSLALIVCKKLGFSKNIKIKVLSSSQFLKLTQLINKINLIGNKLKKVLNTNFEKKLRLKLIEPNQNLPIRRQCHTDSKTPQIVGRFHSQTDFFGEVLEILEHPGVAAILKPNRPEEPGRLADFLNQKGKYFTQVCGKGKFLNFDALIVLAFVCRLKLLFAKSISKISAAYATRIIDNKTAVAGLILRVFENEYQTILFSHLKKSAFRLNPANKKQVEFLGWTGLLNFKFEKYYDNNTNSLPVTEFATHLIYYYSGNLIVETKKPSKTNNKIGVFSQNFSTTTITSPAEWDNGNPNDVPNNDLSKTFDGKIFKKSGKTGLHLLSADIIFKLLQRGRLLRIHYFILVAGLKRRKKHKAVVRKKYKEIQLLKSFSLIKQRAYWCQKCLTITKVHVTRLIDICEFFLNLPIKIDDLELESVYKSYQAHIVGTKSVEQAKQLYNNLEDHYHSKPEPLFKTKFEYLHVFLPEEFFKYAESIGVTAFNKVLKNRKIKKMASLNEVEKKLIKSNLKFNIVNDNNKKTLNAIIINKDLKFAKSFDSVKAGNWFATQTNNLWRKLMSNGNNKFCLPPLLNSKDKFKKNKYLSPLGKTSEEFYQKLNKFNYFGRDLVVWYRVFDAFPIIANNASFAVYNFFRCRCGDRKSLFHFSLFSIIDFPSLMSDLINKDGSLRFTKVNQKFIEMINVLATDLKKTQSKSLKGYWLVIATVQANSKYTLTFVPAQYAKQWLISFTKVQSITPSLNLFIAMVKKQDLKSKISLSKIAPVLHEAVTNDTLTQDVQKFYLNTFIFDKPKFDQTVDFLIDNAGMFKRYDYAPFCDFNNEQLMINNILSENESNLANLKMVPEKYLTSAKKKYLFFKIISKKTFSFIILKCGSGFYFARGSVDTEGKLTFESPNRVDQMICTDANAKIEAVFHCNFDNKQKFQKFYNIIKKELANSKMILKTTNFLKSDKCGGFCFPSSNSSYDKIVNFIAQTAANSSLISDYCYVPQKELQKFNDQMLASQKNV